MSNNFTRQDIPPRPPLTQEQILERDRLQAEERRRRGFLTFTDPARAAEVYGSTPGENTAQSVARRNQRRPLR